MASSCSITKEKILSKILKQCGLQPSSRSFLIFKDCSIKENLSKFTCWFAHILFYYYMLLHILLNSPKKVRVQIFPLTREALIKLGVVLKKGVYYSFSSILTLSNFVFRGLCFGPLHRFYQHSLCFPGSTESYVI